MAGPDPDGAFDADEFRAGIRAAMLMGLPQDVTLRPTFYFASEKVHEFADSTGRPFDVTASVPTGDAAPDPVRVLCGIELDDKAEGYTAMGQFQAERATLYFFEDEWDEIHGSDSVEDGGWLYVEMGLKRYERGREKQPLPMFDVTIRQVEVTAADT